MIAAPTIDATVVQDKLALSRWLIGSYRKATHFAPRRLRPTDAREGRMLALA